MAYFKINVNKLENNIKAYNKIKEDYLGDINSLYELCGNSENVTSAWNDSAALFFIKNANNDKNKIVDYVKYFDKLYTELTKFKSNLVNVCRSYANTYNVNTIEYNDENIKNVLAYIKNSIWYLEKSLDYISIYDFSGFPNIQSIYNLRNNISNTKARIETLLQSINNFSKRIDSELLNSEQSVYAIKKCDLNLKKLDYTYSIKDVDLKPIDLKNQ